MTTSCKKCGSDLDGKRLRAAGGVNVLDFMDGAGKAMPGEKIAKPGEPGYDSKSGYIICDCGRQIPVSPRMVREGSQKYDEL